MLVPLWGGVVVERAVSSALVSGPGGGTEKGNPKNGHKTNYLSVLNFIT